MDELDKRILTLLSANARMTIKEIAHRVSLTSPAVSERIRKMETSGIIEGYTVRINPEVTRGLVGAFISISVGPGQREEFFGVLRNRPEFEYCCQVTGTYSHMVRVNCADIEALEKVLARIQRFGQTNTQIILSTVTPENEKEALGAAEAVQ